MILIPLEVFLLLLLLLGLVLLIPGLKCLLTLFAVDILTYIQMASLLSDDPTKFQCCVCFLLRNVAGQPHGFELISVKLVENLKKIAFVLCFDEASV